MASVIGRACSVASLKNSVRRGFLASKDATSIGCKQSQVYQLSTTNIHLRTYYRISTAFSANQQNTWNRGNHDNNVRQRVRSKDGLHLVSSGLVQRNFVRYSSTIGSVDAAAAALASADTNTILDSASSAVDIVSNTVAAVTPLAEPTLRSLGFAAATPPGFVQSGLEVLHIGLDLPWWTSIVIGTIFVRLMMFPLVILAQRNAAHMHNHMPTMTRLQERMSVARRYGDIAEVLRTNRELTEYMHRNDVSLFRNLMVPLSQAVVFCSVFWGLRPMAALPVLSMQTGGILWFTDLTIPDPYYALPLMTAATLLATIEVGTDGVKAGQLGNNMKYLLRAMPFITFPFIIQFPAAMLCYWFTSNAFSLLQVLFLRIPGMREYFKIPKLVDHGTSGPMRQYNVPKKGFFESFRESLDNIKISQEIIERERLNTLRMKESQREAGESQQKQQQIASSSEPPSKPK